MTPAASGQTEQEAPVPFLPVHEAVAAQPPGNVALLTADGHLTYGELDARGNQLARRLLDLGLDRARPIGVCLERSADAVVALLGVLKAGHPYLPFEARQPRAHLGERLRQAGAGALLTHSGLGPVPEAPGLPVLALDRERSSLARESAAPPDVAVAPEDLAYALFTSGSTGRPKCVEVTHGGLAAYPAAFNSKLGLDGEARYLHTASFAFSASLRQLFVPLSVGATVALAGFDRIRDPLALLRWVQQEELTVLDWVPSYLRQVCAELARLTPGARQDLMEPQAGILVSSGEALSWSLVRRWREEAGFRGRIANAYGQTETSGLVAWFEVPAGEPDPAQNLVPLGAALPHAELYCLDEGLAPTLPGAVGDLWVAGPCVARAYRGEGPAMDKRPNPFSPWPELYATGDKGRLTADGLLAFAGRADDLVKVNGARVALGEVEEALRSHPGVRDAAVVAEAGPDGEVRLHAFLEAGLEGFSDEQAVRRHLRERFADHLVPHAITWTLRLPRTPSGKADRPALRAVLAPALEPAPAGAAPSVDLDVEGVVRAAWRHTLATEQEDGDFFELGGDSLQVIAMLGRITTALGLDTPLIAAFFGDPTLPGLLEVIRRGLAEAPAAPLVGRPRVLRSLGPGPS